MRGAEAILTKSTFEGKSCLVKERIPKTYRLSELDLLLRKRRTRGEAKLLQKVKSLGIPCPEVFEVGEFSIKISIIEGERPEEDSEHIKKAAEILATLHNNDVIHGDFTFANLLLSKENLKEKLYVIDFGLGSFSHKIEHKAIDIFTMILSLHSKDKAKLFLETYLKNSKDQSQILKRLGEIEKRVRYS